MVAVFPFVDGIRRATYLSSRLPSLCRAGNATGAVVALQELSDTWRARADDVVWLPRRLKKSLALAISLALRSFSIAGHATLHYLSVALLHELICTHNDIRVFALAMGVQPRVAALLAATSDLTSFYAQLHAVDKLLRLELEVARSALTGSAVAAPVDLTFLVTSISAPGVEHLIPTADALTQTSHLIPLPANARGVTHANWKPKLRFAYRCLQCDSRLHVHEAIKILRAIAHLKPLGCDVATVQLNLGAVYLHIEHHVDEAIACFEAAITHDPTLWKAYYNLAIALLQRGRLLEGKDALVAALSRHPSDGRTIAMLAEVNAALSMAAMQVVASERDRQAFANDVSVVVSFLQAPHAPLAPIRFDAAATYVDDASALAVPVTQPLAPGWDGAIANLLHRLYVFAALRRQHAHELFQSVCEPNQPQWISIAALDSLLATTTGNGLTSDERAELLVLFPHQTMIHALLQPNRATSAIISDVRRLGAAYSHLSYPRPRARSAPSPFTRWLDLPLLKWLQSVPSLKAKASSIYDVLIDLGLFSVLHLAKRQPTLKPQHLKPMDLADRGTLIYELFGLRRSVEVAAGSVIQGAIRILTAKIHCKQQRQLQWMAREDINAHDRTHSVALRDHLRHQEAMRTVSDALHSVLEAIFTDIFALPPLPGTLPCIPLRTELRMRTNLAATSVQRAHRDSAKDSYRLTR
ncbi:hypothetical protein SDRG_14051 [Saprolegnia diclina VS20]|uniref:Uncharacterized protein n=1 Tax=Saprolegnia diclina (strain VS20) TaxID=1156394 RepID=T0RF00_SAPDV|nr:hypothetical protein SDRG_14051 [Saprolegnia diclina VS20]EQC28227.1 hypothetical protein SDRG_14051 [Saprolegnia diclina VS20]|eukprot:XP_008618376.1 hypothetical protein SDRG_14051 [Saprolegnia diclina VS20]